MGGILYTSPNHNFNWIISLNLVHSLQFQPQYFYKENEEVTRHSFISSCPSSLPLDRCAVPSGRLLLHSDFALQEGFPSLFLRPGPVDGKEPGHSDSFSKDRHGLWWQREERRYDPLIWEAFQRGCPLQSLQPVDIETRTGHHSLDSQVMVQSTMMTLSLHVTPRLGPWKWKSGQGTNTRIWNISLCSLSGRSPAALMVLASSSVQESGDGITYWTPTEQHSTWIVLFNLTSASLSTCQIKLRDHIWGCTLGLCIAWKRCFFRFDSCICSQAIKKYSCPLGSSLYSRGFTETF